MGSGTDSSNRQYSDSEDYRFVKLTDFSEEELQAALEEKRKNRLVEEEKRAHNIPILREVKKLLDQVEDLKKSLR